MKLENVKHIIDAYFDTVSPEKILADFEALGYEFEDINEEDYPLALLEAERKALKELEEEEKRVNFYQSTLASSPLMEEKEESIFDLDNHFKNFNNNESSSHYLKAA